MLKSYGTELELNANEKSIKEGKAFSNEGYSHFVDEYNQALVRLFQKAIVDDKILVQKVRCRITFDFEGPQHDYINPQ